MGSMGGMGGMGSYLVPRVAAIRDSDGEVPNMIRNNTVCHVDVVWIIFANFTGIRGHTLACKFVDPVENGNKNVCVVVGHLVLFIAQIRIQNHSTSGQEKHMAGNDVLSGPAHTSYFIQGNGSSKHYIWVDNKTAYRVVQGSTG